MKRFYLLVVLLAVMALACGSEELPALNGNAFAQEYGGNPAVYDEIFAANDCAFLQDKFDIAAGNNERAEPGTPEHRWTLGYMIASEERMKAIGCYE